jgi:hypothetical protein
VAGIWSVNGGIPLGYAAGQTKGPVPTLNKPLRYDEDRHICLVGPNGSGKTMRQLLTSRQVRRHSYCTFPKPLLRLRYETRWTQF